MKALKRFLMTNVNLVRRWALISRVGNIGCSGTEMIAVSSKVPEAKLTCPSSKLFNASRNLTVSNNFRR